MRILFVCSGNTCRSPLAVAAWKLAIHELKSHPDPSASRGVAALEDVEVSSAGLCAQPGARAARFAEVVAREWGISLENHRARLWMPQHADADLIVTMTRDQSELLQSHFDLEPTRVRVLGTYLPHAERIASSSRLAPLWGSDFAPAPPCFDILDPYGGSLEGYQECARHIRRAVTSLVRAVAVGS